MKQISFQCSKQFTHLKISTDPRWVNYFIYMVNNIKNITRRFTILKKTKVMHILTDSNIGGAGKLLYNLAQCIDKEKFEFVLVLVKKSKLINIFKNTRFKIYCVSNGADSSFTFFNILELISIIKKENPDIVHTHSCLSARISSRLAGIPKNRNIYTKHCVFGVPKIYNCVLFRKIYGFFDDILSSNVVAVADIAKSELVKFGVRASKISVIINGVHPLNKASESQKKAVRKSLGISDADLIVGISARLEEYKGHKYFIDAAEIAHKNRKNIKFIIMGDGSIREELIRYAMNKNLLKNKTVIFLGFVDDVDIYMNIFDINVNCSTGTETSSLSLSEGLSLGKPAIVSNFGGNPNMVKEGKTGFIIKQQNPQELYNAIIKISDKRTYKKFSINAESDFYKRFSDKIMTLQYEQLYNAIIRIDKNNKV